MRTFKLILLTSLLLSIKVFALPPVYMGELNTSFSPGTPTSGWVEQASSGATPYSYYGQDIAVDVLGNIFVVGIYEYLDGSTVKVAIAVFKYLPNGMLDSNYGSFGRVDLLAEAFIFSEVKIALTVHGSAVVGFTYTYCPTGGTCNRDIALYNILGNGSSPSDIKHTFFGFDKGGNNNDYLKDLEVTDQDKILIASTVTISDSDTDFGIAVVNIDNSGALALDTDFDTDGLDTCLFDHYDPFNGSDDEASAIVLNTFTQNIIIGGTAFEGNGATNIGSNMAFCEFDSTGNEVRKWSTFNMTSSGFSVEILTDMAFKPSTGLVVAGMIDPYDNDLFYVALGKYVQDILGTGDWSMDLGFGDGITGDYPAGWGFSSLFDFNLNTRLDSATKEIILLDSQHILVASDFVDPNNINRNKAGLNLFTKSGKLDLTWGNGNSGQQYMNFDSAAGEPYQDDVVNGIAIDPESGGILTTGYTMTSTGEYAYLTAKYHNDRIFASGF